MRIVVTGPGAIGCLFAAILHESGSEVILLDKDSARAEAIALNGVTVDDFNGTRNVPVPATDDASTLGVVDFVCICVKAYDTTEAMRHSLPAVGPDTAVVSFQNGLGNVEQIIDLVDRDRVICAVTSHGSLLLGSGHVKHTGVGVTALACPGNGGPHADVLMGIMKKAGVETSVADDWQSLLWSKLVINAAINPVTAINGVTNGALLEDASLHAEMLEAAREAAAVADAKGVKLLHDNVDEAVEAVCARTATNMSSMLQDITRHRRTEIDAITGMVVKEAAKHDLQAPTNVSLLEAVKKKEETDDS